MFEGVKFGGWVVGRRLVKSLIVGDFSRSSVMLARLLLVTTKKFSTSGENGCRGGVLVAKINSNAF